MRLQKSGWCECLEEQSEFSVGLAHHSFRVPQFLLRCKTHGTRAFFHHLYPDAPKPAPTAPNTSSMVLIWTQFTVVLRPMPTRHSCLQWALSRFVPVSGNDSLREPLLFRPMTGKNCSVRDRGRLERPLLDPACF
jgi:hypothetical protein